MVVDVEGNGEQPTSISVHKTEFDKTCSEIQLETRIECFASCLCNCIDILLQIALHLQIIVCFVGDDEI